MNEELRLNLDSHKLDIEKSTIIDLFENDKNRFSDMSLCLDGVFFDYSKNYINKDTIELLLEWLRASNFCEKLSQMFAGKKINVTEDRAVLHTALRNFSGNSVFVDDKDVMIDVKSVLQQIRDFTSSIHSGKLRGFSGKKITNIVNIGIGGSALGVEFVIDALKNYCVEGITCRFISNVDGSQISEVLKHSDPETTLFIISSKTFTTVETLMNANTARSWLIDYFDDKAAVAKHFVAVSTNMNAVLEFGIDPDNMFRFWDWVGGRYSIWSAIGLAISLMTGYENFENLLRGANNMDNHFKDAPLEKNMPVLLGVIGAWYRNFWDNSCYSVVPYSADLQKLPAWLQQTDMESNGKSVTCSGEFVDIKTGSVVFGYAGTDAQHSYFQLIHQGTDIIPVDFIGIVNASHDLKSHNKMLLANMLAQSEALMKGDENDDNKHRHFSGNRPSNSILLDKLDPFNLGMLMALYEHKVFVQGVLWGINSFDQYGVELGKVLAKKIYNEAEAVTIGEHDGSTTGLFKRCFINDL